MPVLARPVAVLGAGLAVAIALALFSAAATVMTASATAQAGVMTHLQAMRFADPVGASYVAWWWFARLSENWPQTAVEPRRVLLLGSSSLSIAVTTCALLRFSAHPRVVGLGPIRSEPVAPYRGDLG
jgi:hypothetical protein